MKFVKFIKNNLLIICAFVILILLSISNVNRSFIDVPYLDGLMQVPTVEKYFSGTLKFSDIAQRWGEHRLIGYTLIFLLNTILFRLNMKMEPFIFVLVYFLIGLVLYFCFKNIFKEIFKDKFKKWMEILYLPILFITFSLVHPPGMLMTTQFVIGTLFFVLVSKYFDKNDIIEIVFSRRMMESQWTGIINVISFKLYFFILMKICNCSIWINYKTRIIHYFL